MPSQLAIAIETSGRAGSVAVVLDGQVAEQRDFSRGLRHAVEMIPTLDSMLEKMRRRPAEIEEVYVSAGPGSFTGLRVAITFAKTLAMTTGCRIVAVPTVDALARNAAEIAEVRHLAVVLDAKRNQVYCGGFDRAESGELVKVLEACLLDPPELLARMARPLHVLGEGLAYHGEAFTAEDVHRLPQEHWPGRAANVAAVGIALAAEGRFAEPDALTPIYIRRPEAEELWEKRHGTA